uniref:Mei2-like C-terminal RNA recognition motif domain-containing protein n=1 Tax=Leersia perrieri TaxID=77586 RepID=A0A0D9VCE1_9ORYZ
MAVTRLNPSARPFHSTRHHVFLAPPPPMPLFPPPAGAPPPPFPFVAAYSSCAAAPFPFQYYHHHHCGGGGYQVMQMASAPPPPFSKGLLTAPPPPHGRPPHKLMLCKGGGGGAPLTVTDEKHHAQLAWRRPAPTTVAAAPRRMLVMHPAAATPARVVARRGTIREYRPAKQRGGGGERERSPSAAALTTGPVSPLPPMEKLKPKQTTVMVRNIPNKLTRMDMVRLLDDHCARENRRRGGGEARVAYDLVYVRMDFGMCNEQRSSNMGYAFVNFTTAAAARGLQRALHGCRWKRPVFDSSKIIDIRAARIQGKEALVRHFGQTTYFDCVTDEYLPAVFSPPRDGSAAGEAKTVGIRVPPRGVKLLAH